MDERLRFVAKLLEGEAMTDVCREFGISRKTGYKISSGTKIAGLKRCRTAHGGPCAMPTRCHPRSRASSSGSSARSRIGVRARSVSSWCAAWMGICGSRPRAPSTLCYIGTGWSKRSAAPPSHPVPISSSSRPNSRTSSTSTTMSAPSGSGHGPLPSLSATVPRLTRYRICSRISGLLLQHRAFDARP